MRVMIPEVEFVITRSIDGRVEKVLHVLDTISTIRPTASPECRRAIRKLLGVFFEVILSVGPPENRDPDDGYHR
jgi:hypothetical protein